MCVVCLRQCEYSRAGVHFDDGSTEEEENISLQAARFIQNERKPKMGSEDSVTRILKRVYCGIVVAKV